MLKVYLKKKQLDYLTYASGHGLTSMLLFSVDFGQLLSKKNLFWTPVIFEILFWYQFFDNLVRWFTYLVSYLVSYLVI